MGIKLDPFGDAVLYASFLWPRRVCLSSRIRVPVQVEYQSLQRAITKESGGSMKLIRTHTGVFLRVFAAIVAVFLISFPLFSQGSAGRILGSITDQSGGVIANATVTVSDVQRGVTRTLITDPSGEYVAPDLQPGRYTVRATGFFGCGCATPDQAAGNPVLGSGGNRAIQLGLKFIF